MKATARFKMDEDLYRQIWRDWIRYVSRCRKRVIPFGLHFVVLGVVFLTFLERDAEHTSVGLLCLLVGVVTIAWHYWDKHRWFSARRRSKVTGQEIEIRFEDGGIKIDGPMSQGQCEWGVFERVVPTETGMFLYPQQGTHIYVPDSALQPREAKPEIVTKIQGN